MEVANASTLECTSPEPPSIQLHEAETPMTTATDDSGYDSALFSEQVFMTSDTADDSSTDQRRSRQECNSRSSSTVGQALKKKLKSVGAISTGSIKRSRSVTSAAYNAVAGFLSDRSGNEGLRRRRSRSLSQGPGDASDSDVGPQDIIPAQRTTQIRQSPPPDTKVTPTEKGATPGEIYIPTLLRKGSTMTKVSAKKRKPLVFRVDAHDGSIHWVTNKNKPRVVRLEAIKEIRSGPEVRFYRQQFQLAQDYEKLWMTIIYTFQGKYKTLHLIAPTAEVAQLWDGTIRKLWHTKLELVQNGVESVNGEVPAHHYIKPSEEDSEEHLDFEKVTQLCRSMNIHCPEDELLRRFQEADRLNRGYLDFPDFRFFVKLLKRRPDLERLFQKCTSGSGAMDLHTFKTFMRRDQKSSLPDTVIIDLFDRFACPRPSVDGVPLDSRDSSHASIPEKMMKLEGFTALLTSPENSIFKEQLGKIHQDMTRPLCDYFISTSHNTYLVGHQLMGNSTREGYVRALLDGCRSVEIDIFDGDPEPIVTHGKTLTTRISLREVCEAIAQYAFVVSPYPIIISAQIDCSVAQQDQIAEIMQSVFGDMLVTETIDGRTEIDALPSPEALKRRILLKARNVYIGQKDVVPHRSMSSDSESSVEVSASDSDFSHEPLVGFTRRLSSRRIPRASGESVFFGARNGDRVAGLTSPMSPTSPGIYPAGPVSPIDGIRQKPKMSAALLALLVYTVGVKCRGLNKKEHYAIEHMFSISERMTSKMLKQSMMDFVKHTRTHLVRLYPNGTRVSSSNFEPQKYWCAGIQLLAINWQTYDVGYMINHAMFQRNGRAGYVLKPTALLNGSKEVLSRRTKHKLEINVISAQQLPGPKDNSEKAGLNPFVEVSIFSPDWTQYPFVSEKPPTYPISPNTSSPSASTSRVVSYRTHVVKNNGFNPIWDEALSIPFECVGNMMDMIFVRFAVRLEGAPDDRPLAIYCTSLASIQEGYRYIPLHDAHLSQFLFSTLFVHISIRNE